MLIRRFILDQSRGIKLEPRREGTYGLLDFAWLGKSGLLWDLNTSEVVRVKKGALSNSVHLNNLTIYQNWKEEEEAG